MKKIKYGLVGLLLIFGLAQLIRPENINTAPIHSGQTLLAQLPDSVRLTLRTSCFDCHSNHTDLKWFDHITPVNFVVSTHVKEGREAFNFVAFDTLNPGQQKAKLYYALNKILSGEMPLKSYTFAHPEAQVTPVQLRQLKNYLLAISPRAETDSSKAAHVTPVTNRYAGTVSASLNGIRYLPGYRDWKVMSTSDRFDNGTMRIIYANDIAVQAIENKKINPWPDGAILAKTAWWQQPDSNGIIHPGKFIQVEFMIKDSKKYKGTKGWGWARWRGDKLAPYGTDAHFDQECISCHLPAKKQDYVFTSPMHLNIPKRFQ